MKAIRQQWLVIKHSLPVVEAISMMTFSEHQNPGFELREITDVFVSARFIEKIDFVESIETPFGVSEDVRSTKYIYFDFKVYSASSGISLIKIIKPPLSLRSFTQSLMVAFGYDVFIKKISFDLEQVYKGILASENVDRVRVSKVAASRIPLSVNSSAKIEILSTENAYDELKNTYKSSLVKLDRIVLDVRVNHSSEFLELSAAGSIFCSAGLEIYLDRAISYD